jgi:transcriptional regulator with XRE-family HTH domain
MATSVPNTRTVWHAVTANKRRGPRADHYCEAVQRLGRCHQSSRESHGQRQDELADELQITRQYLQDIENGRPNLYITRLLRAMTEALAVFLHNDYLGESVPFRKSGHRRKNRVHFQWDTGYIPGAVTLTESFTSIPGREPDSTLTSNFFGGYTLDGNHREAMAAVRGIDPDDLFNLLRECGGALGGRSAGRSAGARRGAHLSSARRNKPLRSALYRD